MQRQDSEHLQVTPTHQAAAPVPWRVHELHMGRGCTSQGPGILGPEAQDAYPHHEDGGAAYGERREQHPIRSSGFLQVQRNLHQLLRGHLGAQSARESGGQRPERRRAQAQPLPELRALRRTGRSLSIGYRGLPPAMQGEPRNW